MKATVDELRRVAADMLRQGGDEVGAAVLVEGADWAAKALEHRNTILGNLETRAEERVCPGCLVRGRVGVHDSDCGLAAALHALDPDWSRREVESCHEAALTMARQRSDDPRPRQEHLAPLTPEERYEDSGGVAGSAPSAVAPPNEDDVP